MDIKRRLANVVENTAGITLTTAEVRVLCRDALARIEELERGAPVEFARHGGQSKSVQKRLAAQINGRKGGRPRKA